jgi:hypothetical protein
LLIHNSAPTVLPFLASPIPFQLPWLAWKGRVRDAAYHLWRYYLFIYI